LQVPRELTTIHQLELISGIVGPPADSNVTLGLATKLNVLDSITWARNLLARNHH